MSAAKNGTRLMDLQLAYLACRFKDRVPEEISGFE